MVLAWDSSHSVGMASKGEVDSLEELEFLSVL